MISDFFDDEDYIKKEVEETQIEETIKKKPKINIFTVMASAVNKDYFPTEEEIDKINPFLFLRYISNDPIGIQIITSMDHYGDSIPKQALYRYVRYSIPNKISYIRYDKKEKIQNEEDIKILQKHYKVNMTTALKYSEVMSDEALEELLYKYRKIGTQKGKK